MSEEPFLTKEIGVLWGSSDKVANSFDRCVPISVTLAKAKRLAARYGVTRVADVTFLDRIGIPSTNVFVPNSRDLLGVYNGKGPTREHSLVSGLMEALERQICALCDIDRFPVSIGTIRRYIDLNALGWIGPEHGEIMAVQGNDLLRGEHVPVPLGIVQCPRQGPRYFQNVSTNGLASGNSAVEAIYHALFELCERHLWSQAHIHAHMWPRALRAWLGDISDAPDDPLASEVIVDSQTPIVGALVDKILRAELGFRLICYAQPHWPTAMLACIIDADGSSMYYHIGMGCSWSPLHAAIRAVTEAAQVRLGDIAGSREDIKPADETAEGFQHGRRPASFPSGRWYFDGPVRQRIALEALPDRSQRALDTEIQMVLEALRRFGERSVIYVDLSPPECEISVARIIAPSLERTLVDGSVSARSRRLLQHPLEPLR